MFILQPSSASASDRAASSYWVGSKWNSTIPVDSCGPVSKRHFLTASRATFANTGCPPTSFAFLTDPFGATVIWTFTTPVMFMRLASSGYTGATLVFVFRSTSCPQARGALVAIHPPISRRPPANTRFKALIDTHVPFTVVLPSSALYSCKDHISGYQKFFRCITLVMSVQGIEESIFSSFPDTHS